MYNMFIIIQRITTMLFQLIVPEASITLTWPILGRSGKLSDLIQQRLVLTGPVLQDLVPKVIDLLTRSSRRVALFESSRQQNLLGKGGPPCYPHKMYMQGVETTGEGRTRDIPEPSAPC